MRIKILNDSLGLGWKWKGQCQALLWMWPEDTHAAVVTQNVLVYFFLERKRPIIAKLLLSQYMQLGQGFVLKSC